MCWLTVGQQFIPALAITSTVSGQAKKRHHKTKQTIADKD